MTPMTIQPEGWAPARGYANGMLSDDGLLQVGGQIGWNESQAFEKHDFVGQMEQALMNVVAIVERAGGRSSDITSLTWFITDKSEYLARQAEVGAAYRRVLGRHFPAMSMVVVAGLIEDEALVEIEATAYIAPDRITESRRPPATVGENASGVRAPTTSKGLPADPENDRSPKCRLRSDITHPSIGAQAT